MISCRSSTNYYNTVRVLTAVNGAETAPDPTPSISAATEEAWHNLVQ